MYPTGGDVTLEVLGTGRVTARIEERRDIGYHGIPGMARRITLRLPDGGTVEGLQVGGAPLRFVDPRVRLA
jgi:hypothetical protein